MLRRIARLSVFGALLVGSASAQAGTLTNATWFQVTQGVPMTRTFGQLGASGTGSTATSIGLVSLSYPFFSTTAFAPGSLLDLAQQITQGGPQFISATNSMASGSPGIPGTVIVMSAIHVGMGANQSMFMVGANTLVQVPLSVGKAGLFSGTFVVTGVLHNVTVDFYAWTPHTLQFTGLTSKGNALPNVTAAGTFNLTASGGGTVVLVSPSKISIDGALAQRRTASFTKLVLYFVPEPGSLLLLGAAGLALVVGMRRQRP
jgi:hypothetical protein